MNVETQTASRAAASWAWAITLAPLCFVLAPLGYFPRIAVSLAVAPALGMLLSGGLPLVARVRGDHAVLLMGPFWGVATLIRLWQVLP